MKSKKIITLISIASIALLVFFSNVITNSQTIIKAEENAKTELVSDSEGEEGDGLAFEQQPLDSKIIAENREIVAEKDAEIYQSIVPFADLPTPINAVDVSNWTQLIAALNNNTVDRINVIASFGAGSSLPTVNREIVINGNKNILDMGTRYFSIGNNGIITISDLEFTGTNALVSGNGKLILTNQIISSAKNTAQIASMDGADVVFDNVDLTYDAGTSETGAIDSKSLLITNGSKVISSCERFYDISGKTNAGATFTVNQGSKVLLSSMKGTTGAGRGQVIRSKVKLDTIVEGTETELKIRGNGVQTAINGGLININAADSTISVLNEATLDIYTEYASATSMQAANGVFTVKNKSKLLIHQIGDNGYDRGASVRFREAGDMTFNIEEESQFIVTKDSGTAPAIRMYGGGNAINVSGDSDFTVINKGSGVPMDPGDKTQANNQGVYYTNPKKNRVDSFTLEDENSSVDIQSFSGAAIAARDVPITITAGTGTYFVVRGKTRTAGMGVFNATEMTINFDEMKYFDFVNTRNGGGQVFNNDAGSSFVSKNSDLSVWKIGENDVTKNPKRSFSSATIYLKDADFKTIETGTDIDVSAGFTADGGMGNYTRLNGNNQNAIVDELRVPTNADKYIWGHVSVPEGKNDGNRDAFTDEVTVIAGVYDKDDNLLYKTTGTIVEDAVGTSAFSVYGDDARGGIFKLDTQAKGDFLKSGQKLKVLEAWRGNKDTGKAHISQQPDDFTAPNRTVLDVTPPTATKLIDENLNNATKVLSGTGAEVNATVYVYYNTGDKDTGTLLGTSTVLADGTWSYNLPSYVEKTKKLSVYLEDKAGNHPAAGLVTDPSGKEVYDQIGLIKPPVTNTATGNINPYNDYAYHDAIFKGVKKYTVADVIPDKPNVVKSVSSSGGAISSVGDVLSYNIKVKNDKTDSYDWTDIKMIDALQEGLVYDPVKANIKVDGVAVDESKVSFDPSTNTLSVGIGDLSAGEEVVVTFDVVVGQKAVDKEVKNKAIALGYSPQESPFVPGPKDSSTTHAEIQGESNEISSGTIKGVLAFVSGPKTIDFGKKMMEAQPLRVDDPTYSEDLVVLDNRGTLKNWTVTVAVKKPMTSEDGTNTLTQAIRFSKNGQEDILDENAYSVFSHKHDNPGEFNVSDVWKNSGDGFKFEVPPTKISSLGKYQAVLEWKLGDTP